MLSADYCDHIAQVTFDKCYCVKITYYCYHLVYADRYGLAQSDRNKQHLVFHQHFLGLVLCGVFLECRLNGAVASIQLFLNTSQIQYIVSQLVNNFTNSCNEHTNVQMLLRTYWKIIKKTNNNSENFFNSAINYKQDSGRWKKWN